MLESIKVRTTSEGNIFFEKQTDRSRSNPPIRCHRLVEPWISFFTASCCQNIAQCCQGKFFSILNIYIYICKLSCLNVSMLCKQIGGSLIFFHDASGRKLKILLYCQGKFLPVVIHTKGWEKRQHRGSPTKRKGDTTNMSCTAFNYIVLLVCSNWLHYLVMVLFYPKIWNWLLFWITISAVWQYKIKFEHFNW